MKNDANIVPFASQGAHSSMPSGKLPNELVGVRDKAVFLCSMKAPQVSKRSTCWAVKR